MASVGQKSQLIMTDPISTLSVVEMNDIFLEGVKSSYRPYVANSKTPEAGSGLFIHKEVPAGKEIFRAMPAVSVV